MNTVTLKITMSAGISTLAVACTVIVDNESFSPATNLDKHKNKTNIYLTFPPSSYFIKMLTVHFSGGELIITEFGNSC